MKKIFCLIFISVIFFSSCSNKKNDELQRRINLLDERITKLEMENRDLRSENASLSEKLNPVQFTFCEYKYKNKHRIIEKEVKTRQLPNEGVTEQYTLFPHCVVLVEDAAKDNKGILWIYVSWQEEIFILKGWIKESDAVSITKDNIKTAAGVITIKKGALIYRIRDFSEIPKSKPELLNKDLTGGTYLCEEGNYYSLNFPGGLEVIVDKKYIEYRKFDSN